ncbi:FliI/YscN family ATPase [Microbulbifer sp. TYP-18]|uniref:FliI/YscN family ATPase n=1 Tax=Microbulbifer sp. TYP-18 TaxID=3230024 RepID=UPI0034C5D434
MSVAVEKAQFIEAIRTAEVVSSSGRLLNFRGSALEAVGVNAKLGELCVVKKDGRKNNLLAEVVGFENKKLLLMPLGDTSGISPGAQVFAAGKFPGILCSSELLGRVIDPLGNPLDDGPEVKGKYRNYWSQEINPFNRKKIESICETKIPAIDGFITLGLGQRVGIFAGSGVGKSTLINNLVSGHAADINVVALIGERGREVTEFIQDVLGEEGLKNSIVIVASAELPALLRVYAAISATTIAEYFSERGDSVLMTMDSITRLAMAQREVGLAAGEPPTSKGYTPSCFNLLPKIVERAGAFRSGGSITAYYTVLVEGDDFNEPIADHMRAVLDGHIVLDRELASQGKYPAINLLDSVSRIMPQLISKSESELVRALQSIHALYESSKSMIHIGAYKKGEDEAIDRAISVEAKLIELIYGGQKMDRSSTMQLLSELLLIN